MLSNEEMFERFLNQLGQNRRYETTNPTALFDQMEPVFESMAWMLGKYYEYLLESEIPDTVAGKMVVSAQNILIKGMIGEYGGG